MPISEAKGANGVDSSVHAQDDDELGLSSFGGNEFRRVPLIGQSGRVYS